MKRGSSTSTSSASKRRCTATSSDDSNASKKYAGAALYHTKYNKSWQQKWPFAAPVKENPSAFHCTVCNKNVSCGHQGEADVVRHSETQQHQKNARSLSSNSKLSFPSTTSAQLLKDKVFAIAMSVVYKF